MITKQINLDTIEKIKELQGVISKYDIDIDIRRHSIVVDAKSFMGIIGLDRSKPVTLVLHTEDAQMAQEIFDQLKDEGMT